MIAHFQSEINELPPQPISMIDEPSAFLTSTPLFQPALPVHPLPMMNSPAMTPILPASIDNVNKQAKIQANEYKKQVEARQNIQATSIGNLKVKWQQQKKAKAKAKVEPLGTVNSSYKKPISGGNSQ